MPHRMGPKFSVSVTGVAPSLFTTSDSVLANGGSNEITSLQGSQGSKLLWPLDSVPIKMTICSVTRYNGPNTYRILSGYDSPGVSVNMLHGHVGHKVAMASYNS